MSQTAQDAINDAKSTISDTRDKLIDDLTNTIGEAEKWLASGVSAETRARFDDALTTAKTDLRKLEDSLLAHSRQAADSVNVYVQDNPWRAVGVGAAVGLLVGLLVSRK